MSSFAIRVAHPDLLFSASHFITYADGGVEALHGHDYRVIAEIRGPLGPSGYLIDFVRVHDALKALLAVLDHRTLLPGKHPTMCIEQAGEEYVVGYDQRRWIFPQADCRVLPLVNTTAEALAEYLAQQLRECLQVEPHAVVETFCVEVREGTGFSGICALPGK